MKIGLFIDTYHPVDNGIVYVLDFTRECLEQLGHEVFVYCPDEKLINIKNRKAKKEDDHVIKLPSLPTMTLDGPRISLFLQNILYKKIKKHNLDAVVFFTPMSMCMMALYTAKKTNAVLIAQHCSDIHQSMDYYPMQIKPSLPLLSVLIPLAMKLNKKQAEQLAKIYIPNTKTSDVWSKRALDTMLSIVYGSCDAVIAVSRKSERQIRGFTKGTKADVRVIPTGVDPLPKTTPKRINELREQLGIAENDEVMVYFGRLGEEKNLKFLFPVLERVLKRRPNAKLLLCGDNEYRKDLEKIAKKSPVAGKIIFMGRYKRADIPAICEISSVYVFPSTYDTQGLTLHEAALGGLPIVMIDGLVTEVVKFGQNGFIVRKSYNDFAGRVIQIFKDKKMAEKFSKNSIEFAKDFTQLGQTKKMADLIEEKITERSKV